MSPRVIDSKRILSGLIFDIERDRLIDDSGREIVREVMRAGGDLHESRYHGHPVARRLDHSLRSDAVIGSMRVARRAGM